MKPAPAHHTPQACPYASFRITRSLLIAILAVPCFSGCGTPTGDLSHASIEAMLDDILEKRNDASCRLLAFGSNHVLRDADLNEAVSLIKDILHRGNISRTSRPKHAAAAPAIEFIFTAHDAITEDTEILRVCFYLDGNDIRFETSPSGNAHELLGRLPLDSAEQVEEFGRIWDSKPGG